MSSDPTPGGLITRRGTPAPADGTTDNEPVAGDDDSATTEPTTTTDDQGRRAVPSSARTLPGPLG